MAKKDERFEQKLEALQRYNRELKKARQLDQETLEDLESKIDLQNKEIELLGVLNDTQKERIRLEKEETKLQLDNYKSKIKQEEKLQKKLGITGQMFKGMEKSLGKLGMSEKHFKKINKEMREAAVNGNGMTAAMKGFSTQAKLLGQGMLKDPAIQAGIITQTFKKGVKIMEYFESSAFELQKELGLGWKQASILNKNLLDAANSAIDIKATYKELVQFQLSLNKSTGLTATYTAKQLDTQMRLVKLAGLSNEEAAKLQEFSDIRGESAENIHDQIVAQNDSLVNNKELVQEVANIGGEIRADYRGNVEALAGAVLQARKLGINLKQAKSMSKGLLDFESSIEAEMEAELLTGKNLNMEKARYLAMQGKSGEAAAELLKNLGSAAEFEKMNVLQKESIAKAMNMEVGALADSLYKKEQYNKLDARERKTLQEKVAQLRKNGEEEKANAVEKAGLRKEDIKLAEKQFTTAQEGTRQMEKAKVAMMSAIAGPLQAVGGLMTKFFNFLDGNPWLKTVIKVIGGAGALLAVGASIVSGVKMISNLFSGGGLKKMFGGKLGSSRYNYMWIRDVDGGGGGDMMRGGSRVMKYLSSKGGFTRTLQRGVLKMFGTGKRAKSMYRGIGRVGDFIRGGKDGSRSIGGLIQKFSSKTSKISSAASKTSMLGKTGSTLSKVGSAAGTGGGKLLAGLSKGAKVLGPLGALLDVGVGGFTGYSQSKLTKEQKKSQGIREDMGAGAATTLGVLTGDASKGSSLSKYVGVKKGGAGDEAMGVAGSAGRGALVGAAVGSVVPVIGTAVGAVAGGIIGAGSELVKVFSDPNSKLRKGVSNFATGVKDKIGESFSYVKDKFTSFGSSLKKGASSLAEGGKKAGKMFLNVNKKLITGGLDMSKKLFKGGVSAIKSIIPKSVTSKVKNVAEKGKDLLKKGLNFLGFANGGITSGGFSPIEAFANGGVVKKPTIGIIGEAGMNEAMVPLPDGKNIPVKMNDSTNNKSLEAKFDKLINVLASHPEIKVNLELDGTKLMEQLSIQR